MTTYRFDQVVARRQQSGRCPTCGKRSVRTRLREWLDVLEATLSRVEDANRPREERK